MKIVITGATGFVGQWVVKEYLARQDDITVLVRDLKRVPAEWDGRVHVIQASLSDFERLNKKDFKEDEYDLFYHFAWSGTSGMERANTELQLDNVKYTCDAVRLAAKIGCKRFVYAGSIMEYEAMQYVLKDATQPGMGNIYSTAKLTANFMAKTIAVKEGIEYINIIISNIYGKGEISTRFLNTTIRKMISNEKISMTLGEQLYDFIYVSDAAEAIVLSAEKGERNSSYYIGNTSQRPLKEYVLKMKEVLMSKSELAFGEIPFCGALLSYKEFDTYKLEKLGFTPKITFAQGVRLVGEWMREDIS